MSGDMDGLVAGEKPASDRLERMRTLAPELYQALKWCGGILCESGNLNNYRNLSDQELGKLWIEVAEHVGHLLNRVDGLEPMIGGTASSMNVSGTPDEGRGRPMQRFDKMKSRVSDER